MKGRHIGPKHHHSRRGAWKNTPVVAQRRGIFKRVTDKLFYGVPFSM